MIWLWDRKHCLWWGKVQVPEWKFRFDEHGLVLDLGHWMIGYHYNTKAIRGMHLTTDKSYLDRDGRLRSGLREFLQKAQYVGTTRIEKWKTTLKRRRKLRDVRTASQMVEEWKKEFQDESKR